MAVKEGGGKVSTKGRETDSSSSSNSSKGDSRKNKHQCPWFGVSSVSGVKC